jgi:hypothetical protein
MADRGVAFGDLAGGGFSVGNRGFPAGQTLRVVRSNTRIVIQARKIQTIATGASGPPIGGRPSRPPMVLG